MHHLDAGNWRHADEMHTALAAELNFPGYYGRNLDALNDVFRDIAAYRYASDPATTGTVLVLAGYGSFTLHNSELAHGLLDISLVTPGKGFLLVT